MGDGREEGGIAGGETHVAAAACEADPGELLAVHEGEDEHVDARRRERDRSRPEEERQDACTTCRRGGGEARAKDLPEGADRDAPNGGRELATEEGPDEERREHDVDTAETCGRKRSMSDV